MKLDLSSHNYTISDPNDDKNTQTISGTVEVAEYLQNESFDLSAVHIRLVCVIASVDRKDDQMKETFSSCLNRLISAKRKSEREQYTRCCSIIEQLTLHNPLANDRGQTQRKIPFCLPIPTNIPSTSVTDIGSISYYLIATTNQSFDKAPAFTSKKINIVRQTVPGQRSIQYIRNYSGLKLITKIILIQNLESSTPSKIPVTARIHVRPARPANRPVEYRCVVVRGIRWRAQEVTKVLRLQTDREVDKEHSQAIEEKSSIRVISNGIQKGDWKTSQESTKKARSPQDENPMVEVPLEISFPSKIKNSSEVDASCYDSFSIPESPLASRFEEAGLCTTRDNIIITIEHRLQLDILTSEDTFCIYKHKLVNRKPLQTALDATFPIRLIRNDMSEIQDKMIETSLPRYEDVSIPPPDYIPCA